MAVAKPGGENEGFSVKIRTPEENKYPRKQTDKSDSPRVRSWPQEIDTALGQIRPGYSIVALNPLDTEPSI